MYKEGFKIFTKAVVLVVILQSSELTPVQARTTVLQWGGGDLKSCLRWLNAGGKTTCITQPVNKSGLRSCYFCSVSGNIVTLFGAYLGGEMCEPGLPPCGLNVQPLAN